MLVVAVSLLTFRGLEKFPDPCGVERYRRAKRPAERGSAFRQITTLRVEVQVRTPTRQPSARIGDENTLDRHDA